MSDIYDFIVIGGGSAGYAAASMAVRHGLRTAVVEGGDEVGGLCILRGCMPSKTLLESSHRAESIRRAAEFGLQAEYLGADAKAIRERKRRLIGDFADYRRQQLQDGRFDFIRGRAAFVDAQQIEVQLHDGGTRRVQARSFLIATGSTVHCADIPGLEETGYWTSDDVLDADHIPKSVIVLGAGAIGLELATFYRGVGSEVTVIQRSAHVLKEADIDVSDAVAEGMEARGIEILRDTKLLRVGKKEGRKFVEFLHQGRERSVAADEVLCALGRQPTLRALGLPQAGVGTGPSGVIIQTTQQSQVSHIFAAGDVCGPHEIVHIAVQQGELAARNAARLLGKLDGEMEKMDYDLNLFAVFCEPQAATVGLTEREAAMLHYEVATAKYLFADHGKSMVHGETHGFVKLIVERTTRKIMGGACVGPHASELIHEIVVAMGFGATAGALAKIPHYHPTLSEIWTYPAEELA